MNNPVFPVKIGEFTEFECGNCGCIYSTYDEAEECKGCPAKATSGRQKR